MFVRDQVTEKQMTVMEFEAWLETLPLDDPNHYQLIDGEVITMPPPRLNHSVMASLLVALIWIEILKTKSGRAGSEVGYKPDLAKKNWFQMDGAYMSFERFPIEESIRHVTKAPEIAIEVISPGNTLEEISTKTRVYLTGGTQLVWVVYTRTKQITVYRADGTFSILGSTEMLDGGNVLPNLKIDLNEFWAWRGGDDIER